MWSREKIIEKIEIHLHFEPLYLVHSNSDSRAWNGNLCVVQVLTTCGNFLRQSVGHMCSWGWNCTYEKLVKQVNIYFSSIEAISLFGKMIIIVGEFNTKIWKEKITFISMYWHECEPVSLMLITFEFNTNMKSVDDVNVGTVFVHWYSFWSKVEKVWERFALS
jgi:hypothetical protein